MYQAQVNPTSYYADYSLCIFCDSHELNRMAYRLANQKAEEWNAANNIGPDDDGKCDEDFYDEAYDEVREEYGCVCCND